LDCGTADRRFRRVNDIGYIPQRDARGSPAEEDRPGNGVRSERLSLRLAHDPLILGVDEAGAAHAGRPARCGENIVKRQAVSDEFVGMHLDLDRALVAPEHGDVGDAGHPPAPAGRLRSRRE
jgi:hypothetical protein